MEKERKLKVNWKDEMENQVHDIYMTRITILYILIQKKIEKEKMKIIRKKEKKNAQKKIKKYFCRC